MTSPISSTSSPASTAPGVDRAAAAPAPSREGAPRGALKVDTVEVSHRAVAAQAMMNGANKAAANEASAEINAIAQDVADGRYRPPADAVAKALVRFERQVRKRTP